MRLKSIEVQGFKSFADKTSLKFGEGLTAVVGPNGSGKSNISDAVRWVLGEQSNKTLRGNKMEDVIFNGTATRKRLGFAEVTLIIDNSDRNLPCDSDEVAISRRYFRSGESEYRINNASVRLKDIHEMFMDTGLGRDGYSMIGQGKIDDIVGTKTSAERRDIFEEAAGISRYRYRKIEAEKKLSQAEDNLVRLRDILTEIESRIGPLKEQSRKATLFLEYAEEQQSLQIGLWLHNLSKYKDLLREQEMKIAAVRNQYEEINTKIATLDSMIDNSADETLRLNAETDEVRRSATAYDEEASKFESDAAVLANTVEHNNDTIKRIQTEIDDLSTGSESTDTEIESKRASIESKKQSIAEEQSLLEQVNNELLSIITVSDDFSSIIDSLTSKLNTLSLSLSDSKVSVMTSRSTSEEVKARVAVVDASLVEKRDSLSKLETELSALDEDLKACDETVEKCTNSLKGKQLILDGRTDKADKAKAEIDRLTLEEGETRRRAAILTDLDNNMEGLGNAVKSVAKASSSGVLRGIHGPISKLIAVDSEYSLAIETALGGSIQDIVADNEEDVKRAISFLKDNKGGRATFHPLSVIKPREFEDPGLDSCYGFVGMADELVQCDSKYKNVISRLLGGVAVAEDLNSAVTIGRKFKHKFRIVTLDGQVVNAGGSMTGGSVIKNAGILSRSGEIKKLLEKADKIKQDIAQSTERHKALQNEIAQINADILVMQSAVTTAQEDKIRVLGEIKRVNEQISIVKGDIALLDGEKSSSIKRLEELSAIETKAAAAVDAITVDITATQALLEEKMGGRDKSAAKRELLTLKVSEHKTRIFEFNKDIEVLEGAISDIIGRSADRQERITRLTAEISEITAKNSELVLRIEEVTATATELRNKAEACRQSISDIISKRDEIDSKIQQMRLDSRGAGEDKEKISGELVRLEERKISMVHEYDDTIKKMYDEYGLTRSEAEEKGKIPDDIPAAQHRLTELKGKIRSLGNVNVAAIEEYKFESERYEFMSAQVADIENSREELNKIIAQLKNQMEQLFTDRFNAINTYFSKVFTELFGGGKAELRLTEPDNTLESGIEIICQPPGKNVSIIEQLSGGEKALIAISIYFAVMKVNPPPFCMLDEVDAALDDVNVNRFAQYLRTMSDKSQFIVITHRRGTMEESDMLYGVTMQEKGISKLLQLNVSELESKLDLKQE